MQITFNKLIKILDDKNILVILTYLEKRYNIIVSFDTIAEEYSLADEINSRIESELEVKSYIQNLKFALNNGAKIEFQESRFVDKKRDIKYTNKHTINKLFPNENPVDVLRCELSKFSVENYMKTVRDFRFPKRSEMREFGKVYNGTDDVYIKIRVELLGMYGNMTTFVMSFHFAEKPFTLDMFPYKKK